MSGKGTKQSSGGTTPLMKSGEEPKSLLLAMLWTALETLLARGDARIFVGKGTIAIFLHATDLVPHLGLVPTDKTEVLAEQAGGK